MVTQAFCPSIEDIEAGRCLGIQGQIALNSDFQNRQLYWENCLKEKKSKE